MNYNTTILQINDQGETKPNLSIPSPRVFILVVIRTQGIHFILFNLKCNKPNNLTALKRKHFSRHEHKKLYA